MNPGTAIIFFFLHCVALAGEEMWAVSSRGLDVPFRSWEAEGAQAGTGALVLVPAAATGPHIPSAPANPVPTTNQLPPTSR